MVALLNFAEFIIQAVLLLLLWIVIIYAVVSTLISFDVIHLRNPVVRQIWHAVESVALPLLRPVRRILPRMGALDFSAFVFLIVIIGVRGYLIPPLFVWLRSLAGVTAY